MTIILTRWKSQVRIPRRPLDLRRFLTRSLLDYLLIDLRMFRQYPCRSFWISVIRLVISA
jgi:hypothetical protein